MSARLHQQFSAARSLDVVLRQHRPVKPPVEIRAGEKNRAKILLLEYDTSINQGQRS
jgi:hypothetical protein